MGNAGQLVQKPFNSVKNWQPNDERYVLPFTPSQPCFESLRECMETERSVPRNRVGRSSLLVRNSLTQIREGGLRLEQPLPEVQRDRLPKQFRQDVFAALLLSQHPSTPSYIPFLLQSVSTTMKRRETSSRVSID